MNLGAVWTEEIPAQIPARSKEDIDEFLKLLDFFDDARIDTYLNEQAVYENMEFCDWIYSKESSELNDMKRELSKKISKYYHIDEIEQQKLIGNIGRDFEKKWVGIDFREEVEFYAFTISKFYKICRFYLKWNKKSDFIQDLSFCYPNIFFDASVQGSFHSLNRRFEEVCEEIVEHLTALNNYREKFIQLSEENKGYREIAEEFQRDSGIECSPQSGRRNVAGLKREFLNTLNNKTETVNCELHTKFKKFNIDREKQDRIYFAPAKKGIQEEKVVVVHIGKHQ